MYSLSHSSISDDLEATQGHSPIMYFFKRNFSYNFKK